MIRIRHEIKKVSFFLLGILLILSAIFPFIDEESGASTSDEVYAVMKHTKKMTLVSVKNQSDEALYSVLLENPDGDIRFVKARGWDRERIDANKVVVKGERPIIPGNNLIILLITRIPAPSLIWTTMDRFENILTSGTVIERSPEIKVEAEPERPVGESEPKTESKSQKIVVTPSDTSVSFIVDEQSSCPLFIKVITFVTSQPISFEVVDKPDWLDLKVSETGFELYYNCPSEQILGVLIGTLTLSVKSDGQVVDIINITIDGLNPPPSAPVSQEVLISVNKATVVFIHDKSQSSCPQYIETITVTNNETITTEITDKPDWLDLKVSETGFELYYSCPSEQIVGALTGLLTLSVKSDGQVVDIINITIDGLIKPEVIPSKEGFQEKEHQLLGDAYIQGRAMITCTDYGGDPTITIRIDVVKAHHAKGRNLISAFIVDITKNGPDSYIQIGKSGIPHVDYDYIAFQGVFGSKDFSGTTNDSCPIGDVGRVVVVIGNSPPSDQDTLSEGIIDIIATSNSGTAQMGIL